MPLRQIDRLSERQLQELHEMYRKEWWTKDRELADVRRMLEHTDLIVAFCDSASERLAAFSRVLTDYVYKALIFDVIVETSSRGAGLGKALLDAIVQHPTLRLVRHLELYCRPELVPFYERWGFTADLGAFHFMRKSR